MVAIVRAVASLANSLGLRTVAEGVEFGSQLDALIGKGCTQGQGHLFSPAVPAAEVPQLIQRLQGRRLAA